MWLAAWIAMTVPAPLVFFEGSHRWEEHQNVSTALWWTMGALPVLAAVVAARWTRYTGRRRTCSALLAATVAATLISGVFLGLSVAVYRWVIPLDGAADWWGVLSTGVLLAAGGAAVGHLIGLAGVRPGRPAGRHGYLIGGAVAVLGVLFAQLAVQLGAEGSTSQYDVIGYGGVGPNAGVPGEPGTLRLPAAGRYAILAVGPAPRNPDCRVAGVGLADRSAELVTIPPGDYGSDAASYAWVAWFDVPDSGTYSLTCRSYDEAASYLVGEVPHIKGAVGALIHWPSAAIWLLGAVPGLLIIAARYANRRKLAEPPTGSRRTATGARSR
ncbi:hypothetical protein GA0070604_3749 [Micromonospora eburnea]|uniref:Uncharacterized protein n=2 Tax=Micromonospora eburnea TaxID=227316 RepID=A0A1C6UW48_9ACTN|nr:hypothetical protein GA0070604_3749 [Micromonospora eburnea]